MGKVISSKNIDGITDLVVMAPIKEGFIKAYENVTYATRLRIVSEALNRVRVSAREHEPMLPFSDVAQRILTLLDFRVGVVDQDLFVLPEKKEEKESWRLQSRRFLYLTATFDGPFEPYMRLIWAPLGPFLDLLFCNCEGYVTASEHSFDEYIQWVRDNQMDSAIFYSTTGLTVRDHLYLEKLERLQRLTKPEDSDGVIARMTVPDPEAAARAERNKALKDLQKIRPDFTQYAKVHELALEALTVLYALANYYPPEWLASPRGLKEGRYLVRAARDLLKGWEDLIPTANGPLAPLKPDWDQRVVPVYGDLLHWYEAGKAHLKVLDDRLRQSQPPDPKLVKSEIQGGLLKAQGSPKKPVKRGALMLMTVTDADEARRFIERDLDIHYTEGDGSTPVGGYFRTIGFTAAGLRRMGLDPCLIDHFPQEFREGMEVRSGLLGDMRENHPRNWTLPQRNWPPLAPNADPFAKARPPVELSEVDFVIQIRSTEDDKDKLVDEIKRLAKLVGKGAALQSYQLMEGLYDDGTNTGRDHFGFRDGISQPKPTEGIDDTDQRKLDEVRLGEVLLGYRNDRDDFAPGPFSYYPRWRRKQREKSLRYQLNGSFMVVRKLEQHVATFNDRIKLETKRINCEYKLQMTEDQLKAKLFGRNPDGTPLIPPGSGGDNDFNYDKDKEGEKCPFAAHIRRANPRDRFQGRRAPRIVRRGMSFDEGGKKGVVFMAYNASLAEQYETIQRWINGGNSSGVSASQNDPAIGVEPKTGALEEVERVFRFVEGDKVIRVTIPDRFVTLHWGLYLFIPSRTALSALCGLTGGYRPMNDALEMSGRTVLRRMRRIGDLDPVTIADEWKRLLEDFDAKDPAERNISPDVWAAMRLYFGGAVKIPHGVSFVPTPWEKPPPKDQPMVLVASRRFVMGILSDWKTYSTEEQLRRIEPNSGPIFVTQQPDDQYKSRLLQGKYHYRAESEGTNAILMRYGEADGFAAGYAAGKEILDRFRAATKPERPYYKLELRRQFLLPALEGLCRRWYGLPDGQHMHPDGWRWEPPARRVPPGPRCPGDFLSPSRNAFYPRPSETVGEFADEQGKAILAASRAFVSKHRALGNGAQTGSVARKMFLAIGDDKVLARNLIGTMIGAIPPMDGNLRGILLEWLTEKTLWRHQAALRRALDDKPADTDIAKACATLYGPVSQAMCKRPAPDLLYRTAIKAATLPTTSRKNSDTEIEERDILVVSLVSAAQRSLQRKSTPYGEVSIVFGGKRRKAYQPSTSNRGRPVHACPAQKMAMGAIMGILAALLDAGRIQALPASLIVRINDWPRPVPPPGQ